MGAEFSWIISLTYLLCGTAEWSLISRQSRPLLNLCTLRYSACFGSWMVIPRELPAHLRYYVSDILALCFSVLLLPQGPIILTDKTRDWRSCSVRTGKQGRKTLNFLGQLVLKPGLNTLENSDPTLLATGRHGWGSSCWSLSPSSPASLTAVHWLLSVYLKQ